MTEDGAASPLVLGALAGAMAALALREAVLARPGITRWAQTALEPLVRAGREGYTPSTPERRRLAAVGAIVAVLCGWLVAGSSLAIALAFAGPGMTAAAVSRRRARYRRAVERSLPEIANAIADSLSAGRSLRGSLAAATASLDGPPAAEMARIGAELDLGSPTTAALEGLRARLRSPRVDAFCAALLSQRLAGGDLAALMRRFADGAAERDRVAEDARTATAQARFTGLLVVAMPSGAALFAELVQPGFLLRIVSSPVAAALLTMAAGLQLAGFVAIRRLSRVVQ
jgi:tight adherence protein B